MVRMEKSISRIFRHTSLLWVPLGSNWTHRKGCTRDWESFPHLSKLDCSTEKRAGASWAALSNKKSNHCPVISKEKGIFVRMTSQLPLKASQKSKCVFAASDFGASAEHEQGFMTTSSAVTEQDPEFLVTFQSSDRICKVSEKQQNHLQLFFLFSLSERETFPKQLPQHSRWMMAYRR